LLKKYINTLIALSITLEEEGGEEGFWGTLGSPGKLIFYFLLLYAHQ